MAYLEAVPKYAFGTAYELASNELDSGGAGDKITEPQLRALIKGAIELGCRHFDCAPLYKTQHIVGQVLKEAIGSSSSSSRLSRREFFIASKLPVNMMRPENIDRSIRRILDELQLNYLDLFLIHAPFSTKYTGEDENIYPLDAKTGQILLDDQENLLEAAWLKLAELKRRGLVRYIGLSNVNLDQLSRLNSLYHVDVVQNEYHIYNQDRTIFDYCEELDVHFEAYAAFGSPIKAKLNNLPSFLTDPVVQRVARENNLTVAQVNIQWIHQQPLSYVIKCDTYQQLQENLDSIHNAKVPMNDMIELDSLNRNVRIYYFDEHQGITKHREYPFRDSQNHQQPQDQYHYLL